VGAATRRSFVEKNRVRSMATAPTPGVFSERVRNSGQTKELVLLKEQKSAQGIEKQSDGF
jgi:hypothetical protein